MRKNDFHLAGARCMKLACVAGLCTLATWAAAQIAPAAPAGTINRNPERRIGIEAQAQQTPPADPRDSTSRPVEPPVQRTPDVRDESADPVDRQDVLQPPGTAASGPSYAAPKP